MDIIVFPSTTGWTLRSVATRSHNQNNTGQKQSWSAWWHDTIMSWFISHLFSFLFIILWHFLSTNLLIINILYTYIYNFYFIFLIAVGLSGGRWGRKCRYWMLYKWKQTEQWCNPKLSSENRCRSHIIVWI